MEDINIDDVLKPLAPKRPTPMVDKPIKIRFRIRAENIEDSIYNTLDEVAIEREEAWRQLQDVEFDLHENYYEEFKKPEVWMPLSYVPQINHDLFNKYQELRKKYEALSAEYFSYLRYLQYIKSEDRELEITPESTVFFMSKEDYEELSTEAEEELDFAALAEAKSEQMIKEHLNIPSKTVTKGAVIAGGKTPANSPPKPAPSFSQD